MVWVLREAASAPLDMHSMESRGLMEVRVAGLTSQKHSKGLMETGKKLLESDVGVWRWIGVKSACYSTSPGGLEGQQALISVF